MADLFRKFSSGAPDAQVLAFVCRKCGAGEDLRSRLKKSAKADLPKKALRVVMTDCQGVCPKRGAFVSLTAPGSRGVFRVVKPDEIEEFVADVIEALR